MVALIIDVVFQPPGPWARRTAHARIICSAAHGGDSRQPILAFTETQVFLPLLLSKERSKRNSLLAFSNSGPGANCNFGQACGSIAQQPKLQMP
ncbi:hypothetical protein NMG60_11015757 [Bertholletia excelsa]